MTWALSVVLWTALSPSAVAGGAGVERDIARTRANLDSLEKLPPSASTAEYDKCAADFSVPKLVEAEHGLWGIGTLARKENLLAHFTFLAYGQDSPTPCESLKNLVERPSVDGAQALSEYSPCRARYVEMKFVSSFVERPPDRIQRCVDNQVLSNQGPAETILKKCRQWDAIYARLYPKIPSPDEMRHLCETTQEGADRKTRLKCVPYVLAFFGDDRECLRGGDGVSDARQSRYDRLQCRSFAAFTRAHQAKDPARCEGLDLCLALMGESDAASGRTARKLRWMYCGQRTPQDAELAEEIGKSLGEIHAALASGSAAARSLSLPEEKLSSLRQVTAELENRYWRDIDGATASGKP